MTTSARNRLPGIVEAVRVDGILARVDIAVGEHHMVAVITAESAEELNLAPGKPVFAVVKATSVMVASDDA